jgi:hypothetical protein
MGVSHETEEGERVSKRVRECVRENRGTDAEPQTKTSNSASGRNIISPRDPQGTLLHLIPPFHFNAASLASPSY